MPITLGAAGLQIINLFDAATVMNRLINAAGYTQERADVVKGVYNYCQTIFNFPCAFIPCITIAIIPAITNSLTLQDRRGVRSVQNSSLRLMGLIAMPCAVGLIVLAEPIVALLGGYTGANLTLATKLMAILGVAVVFNSIVLMTDAIMQAHNHAVIPVVNTLIGGIVKVIVNYILVGNPDIAITGAPRRHHRLLCRHHRAEPHRHAPRAAPQCAEAPAEPVEDDHRRRSHGRARRGWPTGGIGRIGMAVPSPASAPSSWRSSCTSCSSLCSRF